MIDTSKRTGFDESHDMFRDTVRRFFAAELEPNIDKYESQGAVDRSLWSKSGEAGLLCPQVPEAFGGAGLDYSFAAIVTEEMNYAGCSASFPLQTDIIVDYLIHYGSPEQQRAYLPGMVQGIRIGAIAMTEPHAGSDLQALKTTARRDGHQYVIDGSKTYISSGQNADFVIVAAKTDPAKGAKGTSLIIVDADTPGFARGRKLDKIGQHSADTSELFFDGVKVPITNCLGEENRGFAMIMTEIPQERVSQAIMGQAGAQRAFDEAVKFTKERAAFGKTVFDFQNTKFVLADMKAKLQVGWAHLDWMIQRLVAKELTAAEASAAKLWHTETQWEIVDMALQLHGGAGYMNEYPIARLWRDARVQRIYGGTSEILKEVIARAI